MTPGRFIAVVGPSGAGKDSLIDAARDHFGVDGPVRFVTRTITRPQDAGGEAHEPLSESDFRARAAAGGFALHWQAHGLSYGIPMDIQNTIAQGTSVLANLSRSVIEDIRRRYPNPLILVVTASPEILAKRLSARGRETMEDVEARLRRTSATFPIGDDVITIQNNGMLAEAQAAFIAAIEVALQH
ncbi:MAG: phosphonate metabolism protein/1,5-bisphosphokinase (PRPP-forming) PhnN [Alphaproteobacteria bacterium]|nr:phosphonate metabolism protein/1,5-bisphosphokinase (PRPP-forming) PhnN [Alphaproteobacteria bacterium]